MDRKRPYVFNGGAPHDKMEAKQQLRGCFSIKLFAFYVNQMSELNLPASPSTPHVQKRARSAGTS